jgi:sulfatase maturation enzyme AslB (radical SAM superfamily)
MKKLLYKLSNNLKIITKADSELMFIYHTLYGNPKVINQETLNFLELFKKDVSIEQLYLLYQEYPEEIIENFSKILFLVDCNIDERKLLEQKKSQYLQKVISGQTIDRMGLGISKACNFQCAHCINHNSYRNDEDLIFKKSNAKLNISWEKAKKCIDKYVSLARNQGKENCTIHFGTAEPLINWPIIEKTLKYCSEVYSNLTFVFSINTNLSLLTKDIAKVLKQYNVEISTSLDGMMKSNDSIRKTGGKGTFNLIVDKFDLLNEIDYPLDGFSITATSANFDLINKDIIDFASERNMTSIAFDYNLVDAISIPVEVRVEKLMSLKRYANEKNIEFFGLIRNIWF